MILHALAVVLALGLPWLTAVLWLRLLFTDAPPNSPTSPNSPESKIGRWPLLLGYGYIFGLLAATLLLRLQAALGLGLGWWLPMLVLGALAALAWRRGRRGAVAVEQPGSTATGAGGFWPPPCPALDPTTRPRPWTLAAMAVLVLLIGLRLLGLALELWWLPLFPWDAWTTWAVRAQVWTATADLVPFIAPEAWLTQPGAEAYSIPAWHYPLTVSLLATWPVLAFGGWHETVANLPWLGAALALVLALYGQARRWGASVLVALVFVWLLLSLPMLNTHIALAGYADLWLATTLGLGFFAFLHWARDGDRRQAVLAVTAILAGVLIKQEGLVWALLFLPAAVAARVRGVWLAALAVVVGLGVVAVLHGDGLVLQLPLLGPLVVRADLITLPLLGDFPLAHTGSWLPLLQHLLLLDNWHLLPVMLALTVMAAMVLVVRNPGAPAMRAGLVWVLATLAALFVLFFWTPASEWVRQGTSVNRILLQFAPAWLFWILTVWLAFAAQAGSHSFVEGAST